MEQKTFQEAQLHMSAQELPQAISEHLKRSENLLNEIQVERQEKPSIDQHEEPHVIGILPAAQ